MQAEVCFITGPQWIPLGFFQKFYETKISVKFAQGAHFVLGAAEGVDMFSQQLLQHLCEKAGVSTFERVTIFNKGVKDGRLTQRFLLCNGFSSYPDRDTALAVGSTCDIVTLPLYGASVSGSVSPCMSARGLDGDRVLAAQRSIAEPWDADFLLTAIVPIYEKLYPIQDGWCKD